jgi:hypothetical protein
VEGLANGELVISYNPIKREGLGDVLQCSCSLRKEMHLGIGKENQMGRRGNRE